MFRDIASERHFELNDDFANTSLNLLKNLYDGTPVFHRYRDGHRLCAHYKTPNTICVRWRRNLFNPMELFLYPDEFPMPVGVGEFTEKLKWLPSVVRLKPLEKREMFIGDSLEKPASVPREALFGTFKRKLDAFRDAARFLLSQSAGEVIERVAQAARELANYDADFGRENVARLLKDVEPVPVSKQIRIRMGNGIP
jgi:hypothetical protein